jgi:hypothetical protein
MSQQAAAGQGPGRRARGSGAGRRHRFYPPHSGEVKGFKLAISKIVGATFNMGKNKFAVQFTQSRKVANYLQRTSASKGYLVAKAVRTGKAQRISLPAVVDMSLPDAADLKIIRDKRRYRRLKDELANNYLLGTDQYPDTFDKAMRILGNYQVSKPSGSTGRPGADASGVAFIQQGSRGGQEGQGGGRGRGAG